jgi:peptidoglycan glycosyltransferase
VTLEKRAWLIADAIVLVLALLSLRLVYWQMVRGENLLPWQLVSGEARAQGELKMISYDDPLLKELLIENSSLADLREVPQPVIQRLSDLLKTITRGSIYDRNGRLLAADQLDPSGDRVRFYEEPSLAHVIGYVSGLRTGIAGLERTYDEALLGLDRLESRYNRAIHRQVRGNDLILTIDSNLQRAAEEALEGRPGSITVMDAHTGAILAMAGLPRYDPNRVLEDGYISGLLDNCDDSPECSGIMLNRATQALYPPGSTWKTVTLIAALDTGQVTPETVFDFGNPEQSPNGPYYVYRVGGGIVPDPNHSESKLNLEMSYAKSANAAFARIGDEMPAETLIDYAGRLGYGSPENIGLARERFPLELDFSPGQLAYDVKDLYENDLLRAVTAIGQGELLTSPINLGMVVLSVLNDGNLPLPYLVESIRPPSSSDAVSHPHRTVIPGIMKPETANLVRQMMVTVVNEGSGQKAAVKGLTVGGKTGTAQVGGDLPPHAWFAGFAEDGEREVVIVVMVENGGEGSQTAAPIFAKMAEISLQLPIERPPVVPTPEATSLPAKPESTVIPTQTSPQATEPGGEVQTTPTPTPQIEGLPPPDIPFDPDKVDFTELGSTTCPGNQEGPTGSGKFIWPSVYQAISGGKFNEDHPGIDLSAPQGSAVYAADTGLVIFAGWSELGYGNVIVIDHGNGYKTLYAHLSQVSKYCGAKVQAGQLIGLAGNTGNSTGGHLHFEVRVPGGYINPMKVLPTP